MEKSEGVKKMKYEIFVNEVISRLSRMARIASTVHPREYLSRNMKIYINSALMIYEKKFSLRAPTHCEKLL